MTSGSNNGADVISQQMSVLLTLAKEAPWYCMGHSAYDCLCVMLTFAKNCLLLEKPKTWPTA